jgi:hypothetical protein
MIIKKNKITNLTAILTIPLIIGVVIFSYILNVVDIKIIAILFIVALLLIISLKYSVVLLIVVLLACADMIPIPKGGRALPALALSLSLLSIAISTLKSRKISSLNLVSFFPAMAFSLVYLWGYIYGVFFLKNEAMYALSEFQCVAAWIIAPALFLCFREDNRNEKIIQLIISIGLIISIITIVQYFTGISISGRVEQLETLGDINSDITRATISAKLFVLFVLFTLLGWLASEKFSLSRTAFIIPLLGIILFALIVTFGRALWACAFIGVLVTTFMLGSRPFLITLCSIIVASIIVSLFLAIFSPDFLTAITDRLMSVFKEGATNSSLGWRLTENNFAERSIWRSPFFGIGFGGVYKPPLVSSLVFLNQTTYIHNSYYFLAMKLGLWSLFLPVIVIISFAKVILERLKLVNTKLYKSSLASGFSCILSMAALGVTQPEWISISSIGFLACFMALLLLKNPIENPPIR